MKKWALELNWDLSKEVVQMASKYMKCSTFLVKKEMQIKTTVRSSHPSQNGHLQGCSETGTITH
jgi:hypothetical protein